MTQSALQHHIQLLLDDEISADEFAVLETELLENPGALETYRAYARLHCGLYRHCDIQQMIKSPPVVPIDRILSLQRKFVAKVSLLGAAAIVILSAAVMFFFQTADHQPSLARFQVAPGSDFTLSHSDESNSPVGDTMTDGSRLVLRHGVVELKFPYDVRAVIEAPAEMILRDDRTLEVSYGRALFQVKSEAGRGFTVVTPHQRIVDLGTAFGIDFQQGSDEIELHVLEGSVRIDANQGDKGEIIKANRSVLLAGKKVQREIAPPSLGFLRQLPSKIDILLNEEFDHGILNGQNYIIRMDPTIISDLAGNNFQGIDDDTTWNFNSLATTATVLPTGATWNYFHPLDAVDPALADTDFNTTWYTQNDAGNSYDGPAFAGSGSGVFGYGAINNTPITQKIGIPDSGNRYTAYFTTTFDLGAIGASSVTGLTASIMADDGAFIYINGQPAANYHTLPGNDTYLAGMDGNGNVAVSTNITLDKSLLIEGVNSISVSVHQKSNDSSDLGFEMTVEATFKPIPEPTSAAILAADDPNGIHPGQSTPTPALSTRDNSPPLFIATYPADDSINATQGGQLKMLFNEPIKLGPGRVFIQNVTEGTKNTLVSGSRQLSTDGRVLTINPPTVLSDGSRKLGWLAGWESDSPVIFLNSRGDGKCYSHDGLQDDSPTRGLIGSMRSQGMVGIRQSIRRGIGTITADSCYTVSTTIGVGASNTKAKNTFLGYTIRLNSGDTELAKLTSNTPPSPRNSVSTVGFSWDSSILPDGVHPGDPLAIEITPNQTSNSGYLNLNAIRISVLDQSGR